MKSIDQRLQKIVFGGDVADAQTSLARVHQREHAIVRSDETIDPGVGDDRPAGATHAGIYHNHVDGPLWIVGIGLRNGQCAIENVEGLYRMADVNDLRVGHDAEDDAFHCPDKVVVQAEVGGQSDDGAVRQVNLMEFGGWIDLKVKVPGKVVQARKSWHR